MKKSILFIGILAIIFISGCVNEKSKEPISGFYCPNTELFDFNQQIETKEEAISLLKEFFSEENGYPPFNANEVWYGEQFGYVYMSPYGKGINDKLVGGALQTDGKLIQKGYCK